MSRILWINPVGTDRYDRAIGALLRKEARKDTQVDISPRTARSTWNTTPTRRS
jgi:hypothetical protein